jgi:hypothetical protein
MAEEHATRRSASPQRGVKSLPRPTRGVGYLPFDATSAAWFFELIASRYEPGP